MKIVPMDQIPAKFTTSRSHKWAPVEQALADGLAICISFNDPLVKGSKDPEKLIRVMVRAVGKRRGFKVTCRKMRGESRVWVYRTDLKKGGV